MKKHVAIALGATMASMLCVSAANAQAIVTTGPAHETVVTGGPNSALLGSGLFAFGMPYVASVIVASTSNNDADHHLYVPVVGPWMDLVSRGGCGAITQNSCDSESVNKALLAGDGILQSIGALQIVAAFLMPEVHATTIATEPRVVVGPSRVGRSGYGLAAGGTF
jgi:hypothetical protein